MGMIVFVRRLALALPLCLLLAGCADPLPPGDEGPPNVVPTGVPDVAEIVCEADGSTTIVTPSVLARSDGVHVHVVSHLDEPASLNGFGFDVDEGETDFVVDRPPGVVDEACWPFSLHDTLEEPPTHPIHVLDPDGTYVSDEVQCSGSVGSGISDFAESPIDAGPVPLDVARERIDGLQDGDVVTYAGYPSQRDRSVIVVRDGEVVASFSFVTFDGSEWTIASDTICVSSGLRPSYD